MRTLTRYSSRPGGHSRNSMIGPRNTDYRGRVAHDIIEVCEDWIDADAGKTDRHNCRERLTGMLRLMQEFKRVRNDGEPADLPDLYQWTAKRIIEDTRDGNEQKGRIAILDVLFSCPANLDYTFLSDYLYRQEGLSGAPTLVCFWHRGEQIYGISGRDGGHAEVSSIRSVQVDSLASSGRRAMEADELETGAPDLPERRASTTEGSRRIHPTWATFYWR